MIAHNMTDDLQPKTRSTLNQPTSTASNSQPTTLEISKETLSTANTTTSTTTTTSGTTTSTPLFPARNCCCCQQVIPKIYQNKFKLFFQSSPVVCCHLCVDKSDFCLECAKNFHSVNHLVHDSFTLIHSNTCSFCTEV